MIEINGLFPTYLYVFLRTIFESLIFFSVEDSFKLLQPKNINRTNRQIIWGIKAYFRQKFDPSTDLLIKDRILPAKLFISKEV